MEWSSRYQRFAEDSLEAPETPDEAIRRILEVMPNLSVRSPLIFPLRAQLAHRVSRQSFQSPNKPYFASFSITRKLVCIRNYCSVPTLLLPLPAPIYDPNFWLPIRVYRYGG